VQGSLHSNVLAAKAVCLGEALQPEFRRYGAQVVANARALGRVLQQRGIKLVGGGTDSHMLLLDLSPQGILGRDAEQALAAANITSNKNPIPFDKARPADWSGLRLGVAAATTRGFDEAAMTQLGECIADLILAASEGRLDSVADNARPIVAELCNRFPLA
jgi:glycine hydroxymethyltransferase